MKLKPSKRMGTIMAVVALVIVAFMVSNSRKDSEKAAVLDAPATQACADFAAGYPKAESKTERLALADKVTASSGKTDNQQIQQKAADMGAAAGDGGAKWKSSADALTAACRDAGWKAA